MPYGSTKMRYAAGVNAAASPGDVIDQRYEVLSLVGRGGIADVFRARDHQTGQEVALKLLRGNLMADDEARARFGHEAHTQSLVSHRNVAVMYGGGVEKSVGRVYLVMELLGGKSIAQALHKEKRFEPLRAAVYAYQALAGLAAPQVGVGLAVCVIEDPANPSNMSPAELRERGRKPVPFHALFNPTIELLDTGSARFFEGCLSVSGMTAIVPRAKKVRVHALDHKGKAVTIDAAGWYARILQHEIDHLNGVIYIDRMASRTFMSNDAFARTWRGVDIEAVELALSGPPPAAPVAPPATASRARARRPSPAR